MLIRAIKQTQTAVHRKHQEESLRKLKRDSQCHTSIKDRRSPKELSIKYTLVLKHKTDFGVWSLEDYAFKDNVGLIC